MSTKRHTLISSISVLSLMIVATMHLDAAAGDLRRAKQQNFATTIVADQKAAPVRRAATAKAKAKATLAPTRIIRQAKTRTVRPGHGGPARNGGLGTQLPADLVIIPYYDNDNGLPNGFPTHSYCSNYGNGGTPGHVRFYIRNIGDTASAPSHFHLSFPNAGDSTTYFVPSLAPGSQLSQSRYIPNGCYTSNYSGTCAFTIEADNQNEVVESNENNNDADGFCVSPAT